MRPFLLFFFFFFKYSPTSHIRKSVIRNRLLSGHENERCDWRKLTYCSQYWIKLMKTYVIWVFDNIPCMNLVKTWPRHKYPPKPQVRPRVAPLSLIPIFNVRYFALLVVFLQHVNGSPTCVHKSCTAQQIALIWNRLTYTNSSFCSMVKDRQMPPTVLYVKVNLHRAAINKGFPEKFPISTCSVNRTLHDRNKVIGCPFIAVRRSANWKRL